MNFHMEGFRCVVNCEPEAVEEGEIALEPSPWSDPDSWPSGAVPVEGEEVVITATMWIEFDLEETPILKSLDVNGRLHFKNDPEVAVDRTIHAYWVYVRAGELFIGSEDEPYNGDATIYLYGENNGETLAFSMFTEGGNKGLFVVGYAAFYGQPRDGMSRLRESTFNGDNTATVYAGLDWKAGDEVSLLATASFHWHTEQMTIESYDADTGIITFTDTIKYYHFGQSKSTESDFSGVDMRGEVILLTRNVKVIGEDIDSHGA